MNWIRHTFLSLGALSLICGIPLVATSQEIGEVSLEAPWYASGSIGGMLFEGDEELKNGFALIGRVGYDHSEWWTWEGGLMLAPSLDGNDVGNTFIDDQGNVVQERIPLGPDDTWALGLTFEGLYHFTRWERVDPFLALGGGLTWYEDEVNGENFDPSIRVGGGVMYHFNDEWAVRADGRTFIAGNDTEANAIVDGGVVWTWGARIPPDFTAVGGPLDSDGDGLPDDEEPDWNTDPFDPDTDKDGLSDGEEVYEWKTVPTNPDTDHDALTDGFDEVHKYGTHPLVRDTDGGGVADGHEVIEDDTNPLDPSDDLMLIELYIQFDYNKAIIKPEYYAKIDVIAKVLNRNPGATARIEGHADRTKKSKARYNKKLSRRRATAVLDYLADNGKIDRSRMTAHGYGFERPKGPVDLVNGNPEYRRVEVYLRGVQGDVSNVNPDASPSAVN